MAAAGSGATGTPSLQELLHHLRGPEGALPATIRRPLLATGATVVPALITLVASVLADEQTDLGWAPLHAIELLGALGDARAIPVLLRCLDHEDELDLLVQQAAAALHRLGALALDRCLDAYATTPREAFRNRLAGVMSRWGLHDERIYAALLETLQRHGQAFLSSTTLDGTFVLRACIINPRTQPEDLECLVALVRDLGTQLAKGGV